MENSLERQQETIKTFKAALPGACSNKRMLVNGAVNKEALLDAVKSAFRDITPRTMTRNADWRTQTGCVEFNQMYAALFDYCHEGESFGDQLKGWFEEDCPDDPNGDDWKRKFDAFHGVACKTVMEFLRVQRYEEQDITYGKAQKVVNMTFKFIYCLDGAHEKEEWFIPCHMALDSFTLEWFGRNVQGVTKGCIDSWSALQNIPTEIPNRGNRYATMKMYTKPGKDAKFYTYTQIVSLIRNHFEGDHPYRGLCPLQAEFYIWPEIQLHLAAEALYGQNVGMEEALAAAKETWENEWITANVDDREPDKQFDWCKKKFKQLPIERKMEYLDNRVSQMVRTIHIYRPQ